jgi:hypothetical protein
MRPILKPALRRVWRDDTTLQLGLDPERALVLRGMGPPLTATLDLLDGTRQREQVLADARDCGVDAPAAAALLDLLGHAQAVDDLAAHAPTRRPEEGARLAPDLAALSLLHPEPGGGHRALARRGAARVLVVGGGRVGSAVALLLGAAGVGRVDVEDEAPVRLGDLAPGGLLADDLGLARGDALRRRLPPQVAGAWPGPLDLVLLTPAGAGQPDGRRWRAAGVAHLAVGVRETTAVVGPLVLPGTTCCLSCLDLHRTERDPGWPVVASQLQGPTRGTVDPCEVALATLAASLAALQALAWLSTAPGAPPPAAAGGTLELALPDWRVRRRSWSVHPACDCIDQR